MKKTALYDRHVSLGAKMVDFAGWQMPIQYKGIIQEHDAVRNHVGIFDVSHMGRILVEGVDAETYLDYLSTNHIAGKPDGSATYTVWCHADKGCVDDVIIYKEAPTRFFVVVNASNREKDLEHLKKHVDGRRVFIQDHFSGEGILAIQGPQALEMMPELKAIKPMHFVHRDGVIYSRTGYTGAGGFEIYGPESEIVKIWDAWIARGAHPIGLGARDTLRLEMGYALYGHEISDDISVSESVASWTLKNKSDFLGKSGLEKIKHPRHEYGVILEQGIAREGYEVFREGKKIGHVTSGTFSPTLKKAIAIILSDDKLMPGDKVEIKIRQQLSEARVEALPFIKR